MTYPVDMSRGRVDDLSSAQVCTLTGVTYRQLDYWTRSGLVTPSHDLGLGHGNRRRWSRADLAGVRRLGDASRRRRASLADLVDA